MGRAVPGLRRPILQNFTQFLPTFPSVPSIFGDIFENIFGACDTGTGDYGQRGIFVGGTHMSCQAQESWSQQFFEAKSCLGSRSNEDNDDGHDDDDNHDIST